MSMLEFILILVVSVLITLVISFIEALIAMWVLAFAGIAVPFKVVLVILFLANMFFGGKRNE